MPLDQTRKNAWVALLNAQETVHKKANRALAQAGCISLETYDVLLALEEAPDHRLDMTCLAERVLLTASGISRLVERIAKAGLVHICRSSQNHRFKIVSLTPQGLEERKKAWQIYEQVLLEEFAPHVSEQEAQVIADALVRVCPNACLIGFAKTGHKSS